MYVYILGGLAIFAFKLCIYVFTNQEELTEGDVRVRLMGSIASAAIQRLLHVLIQLVAQCAQWARVHDELPRRRLV